MAEGLTSRDWEHLDIIMMKANMIQKQNILVKVAEDINKEYKRGLTTS